MTWQKRTDRRPEGGRQRAGQDAAPALAAWLSAETEDDEERAETALGALFSAVLPPIAPPPGLGERVLRATVWSVEPSPAEVARGWWRAAAVLAGLALLTLFAGSTLAPSVVGLLDPAAKVAGTLETLLTIARAAGGWVGAAAHVADVLPRLGGAALLVASSPQALAALALAVALTGLAIKVLHQVIERDRRLSHAEAS